MNDIFKGEIHQNFPLQRYTTWRVGGGAQRFFQPKDAADLARFLVALSEDEKLFWLGLGSNVLIRDGGIKGTVISPLAGLQELTQVEPTLIRAQAGVACAKLARFCARSGLAGGEFWAGIPGTVGGALAMNAGCFGHETWQFVEAVEIITRQGKILKRTPADYKVGYREVSPINDEWFIAGYFRLQPGNKEVSLAKIRELLDHRTATQPTGDHSCGSVFRNPPGDYAGRLIENAGLKGMRCGGAVVSSKHANFIINEGSATANDIESLIKQVVIKVKQIYEIDLIHEVKIVGNHQ